MKKPSLIHFHHKYLTANLLALVILLEVRDGYFKGFGRYLKSFSLKPYRWPLAALLFATLLMIFDPVLLLLVQNQDSPLASFMAGFGGRMGRSSERTTDG